MPSNDHSLMTPSGPSLPSSAAGGAVSFGTDERGRPVSNLLGGAQATLPCAAAAIARVEREMDLLWRHALSAEGREVSERLVQVSHLLHRALRLIEGDPEIG